jgi:hypothetical protein
MRGKGMITLLSSHHSGKRDENQDSLHWRRKPREKGRGKVEGRS